MNGRSETLLRLAVWSILLAVITHTWTDPDLWGHVRFGLDLLRDSSLARVDPYSFTSDREWVNHEWAAEAISGAAFAVGGNAGLVLLKVGLVVTVLVLLHATLRRERLQAPPRRDLMAGIAVITTLEQAHHVRPQLFSLVFFALLLWCLTRHSRDVNHRWLIALPPLFGVWANFHGGWIVGGVVLMAWTGGLLKGGGRRKAEWCAAVGAVCLAATLVTPYGVELWTFLYETVDIGRADIREWQPIYSLGPRMSVLWAATVALAVFGIWQTRRSVLPPERLFVVALLALASLQVGRLLAFFALATLFLFGVPIADGLNRRRTQAPMRRQSGTRAAIAAVAVCLIAISSVAIALNVTRVRIDPRHAPEAGAVEFLQTRTGGRRVLVWFDWGQYAIWHLAPVMQVSIDGRRETVYSPAVIARHLRFYFDAPGGATLPEELGVDYVWIPRSLPATERLRARDGWARVYEGEQAVIFARNEPGEQELPGAFATVGSRRFPGP